MDRADDGGHVAEPDTTPQGVDADAPPMPPVIGTTLLTALVRIVTSLATLLIVWPMLGVLVTLLFRDHSEYLAAGVALELVLTSGFVVAGVVIGLRMKKDPQRWYRAAVQFGWFIAVDVVIYLAGVLGAAAVVYGTAGISRNWTLYLAVTSGNVALLWLAVGVIRRARAFAPPPSDGPTGAR
jgi:hypothetical protein